MLYLLLGVAIGVVIYYKFIVPSKYWSERNVRCEQSWPVVGSMSDYILRRRHVSEIISDIYRRHREHRYVGFMHLTRPALMLLDLDLINQLSSNFQNRSVLKPEMLKSMHQVVGQCSEDVVNSFKTKEQVAVHPKRVLRRFALDVVAALIYGYEQKTQGLDSVIKHLRRINNAVSSSNIIDLMSVNGRGVLFDWIQEAQEQSDRSDELLVGASCGFQKVVTTASFVAYELAVHPEIQKKLQNEIDTANKRSGGKISYETLESLEYLQQVVSETLRLWPATVHLLQTCTDNYKISSKLGHESEVVLEKGALISIPVVALQRDQNYFSEPERFNPERFNPQTAIKPGTYLPFGLDPIGSAFTLLQVKTLFVHLLSKLDIVALDRTHPLKLNMKEINLAPEPSFKLGFKPRTFY